MSFFYYMGSENTKNSDTPKTKENIIYNYSYRLLLESPDKYWVGKTLKIAFDSKGGKSIANKTKLIKITSYQRDNDGFEYFKVTDLSHGYLNEVYFFWFENLNNQNGVGPNIKYYEEAI